MTATEAFNTAKKAFDETNAAILNDILNRIETAANKGEFQIYVSKIPKPVSNQLETAGYIIRDLTDQREGSIYQILWDSTIEHNQ